VAARSALARHAPLALLALGLAGALVLLPAGCQASESLPPPPGIQGEAGVGDIVTEAVRVGSCPGTGKVTVAFDGGSGEAACWSAFSTTSATEITVSLASNVTAPPGLDMGIILYENQIGDTKCAPAAGSKLALDGPCVFVSATYISSDNKYVWQAFGGTGAKAPFPSATEGGAVPTATGTITVGSYGSSLGNPVSVTFSPDSTLIVNEPGYPRASITGSVTAAVE
jgi:hypothetical protein